MPKTWRKIAFCVNKNIKQNRDLDANAFALVTPLTAGGQPVLTQPAPLPLICSYGGNQKKAGHSGRWCVWQDMPADCVQQGPVSRGLRAHRV